MLEPYDVRRLPEEGLAIDEALPPSWLEAELNQGEADPSLHLHARGEGRARLTLRRVNPEAPGDPIVRIQGQVQAAFHQPCVRCLTDVEFSIQGTTDLTLFPASAVVSTPEEDGRATAELAADPLDEGTYQGHLIDLPALVREAILLEVAMNPSCADEAACAERTATLIAQAGAAGAHERTDPRWASLAALRDRLAKDERKS